MRLRQAATADVSALRALWMQCFGDAADYVDLYFQHSFDPARVFVAEEDGVLCAMLISFPVSYLAEDGDEQPGAYLYAVCTAPTVRGRGFCRQLMAFAEQALLRQGCAFTCLKAGSEQLSAMYARMGYRASFNNRTLRVQSAGEPVAVQAISAAEYHRRRQLVLRGGFVDYAPEVLAHQARLGPLFCIEDSLGAAERYGETLILKEFLGDEALLPAIGQAFAAKTVVARVPGNTPFAMAKSLCGGRAPTGYLAFAFD